MRNWAVEHNVATFSELLFIKGNPHGGRTKRLRRATPLAGKAKQRLVLRVTALIYNVKLLTTHATAAMVDNRAE